jgi:dTMP kinase
VTFRRGVFVTFEGVEGSGKTTLVEMTFKALERFQPLVVREPGGTALGERLRELGLPVAAEAEVYTADGLIDAVVRLVRGGGSAIP